VCQFGVKRSYVRDKRGAGLRPQRRWREQEELEDAEEGAACEPVARSQPESDDHRGVLVSQAQRRASQEVGCSSARPTDLQGHAGDWYFNLNVEDLQPSREAWQSDSVSPSVNPP
jgi:hypothetical protein